MFHIMFIHNSESFYAYIQIHSVLFSTFFKKITNEYFLLAPT